MFNRLVSTTILLSFLTSNYARAEEPAANNKVLIEAVPTLDPKESDPGKVISPMRKGQKAPYTGVLLAPQSLASVVAELESVPEKIKIDVNKAVSECQTKCELAASNAATRCTADKAILQSSIDANEKVVKAYDEKVKKLESQKTNPLAWLGVGAAGGIAVTILTVFAVSSAKK